MKKIIFIILIFFITKSFSQNELEKTIKNLGYKTEIVYEYQPKFGEIDLSTKFLSKRTKFDKYGQTIKIEKYYKSEYLKEYEDVMTYQYVNGKLTKTVVYNTNGGINSIVKHNYKNGKRDECIVYNSDGDLSGKTTYIFDKRGNIIKSISYDSIGKLKSTTINEYDKKNDLTKSTDYDKDGKIEETTIYTKGEKTNIMERYNKKNELEIKAIEKLGKNNLILEELYFYNSKKPTKTIFEYDENGLIIKRIDFGENGEPEKYEIIERK